MIKPFRSYDVYEYTGWLANRCANVVVDLDRYGMCIVDKNELEKVVERLKRLEDDGK